MPPKDDKSKQQSDNESLEGLHKAFGDMTKQFSALPGQVAEAVKQGINSAVAEQNARQTASRQEEDEFDDPDEDDDVSADDLEKMSRTEFANSIMKRFEKSLNRALRPLEEGLRNTGESAERDKVAAKFNQAREKIKDFDDWKNEMAEIVNEKGYLDPEELYILAKAKYPEKAKELEEAAAKAQEEQTKQEQQNQEKSSQERPAFLGLMPTNSGGTSDEDSQQYKNTKEAAEAAFDEILGQADEGIIGESKSIG